MTCREKILSEDYAEFLHVMFNPTDEVLKSYGAECAQNLGSRFTALYTPLSKVEGFATRHYNSRNVPKMYGLMNMNALEVSGVLRLANQPVLNLKGQGVILGIVDTGIDYTHPAFIDQNGNTRILRIWDQSTNEGNLPQPLNYGFLYQRIGNLGLNYGSEYTDDQINEALRSSDPQSIVPSTDEVGHGTFLAGVAGGSPSLENNFVGAAPEVKFIIVKLKPAKQYLRRFFDLSDEAHAYQENDIMAGINYIRTMAGVFNMPVSLLLGVGTNMGGHDGKSPIGYILEEFEYGNSTTTTVAAGNEGNARRHYEGIIESNNSMQEVEIMVGDNVKGFSMEIWGDAPQVFSIGIVSPTGEAVPRIPARIGETQNIRFLFEDTTIFVEYNLVDIATGDEFIFLRFDAPSQGVWRIQVYGNNISTGKFSCWLPTIELVQGELYFLRPSPYTTITDPANNGSVITTTAYDSTTGAFFSDSSRGFTRKGDIKPDIAAPGVGITGPNLRGGYEARSGTSCAAAITAGACAQFLTWAVTYGNQPWMSEAEVRSYLIRGARRKPELTYPNQEWGFGTLDIYNSFEVMRMI